MSYNKNHAGVKRLMREAIEMKDATDLYHAQPLNDENLFEWHFTVRGPPDTEFENGIYHGRISFPPEYPMKPPSIFMLTKNGRFEVNKKICLSISGYHPETWLPSWSVRTALLAIIGFMPSKGEGAIGSLDYTPEERRNLAKFSLYFKCPKCGVHCGDVLKPREQIDSSTTKKDLDLAKSLVEKKFVQQASSSAAIDKSETSNGNSNSESNSSGDTKSNNTDQDITNECPISVKRSNDTFERQNSTSKFLADEASNSNKMQSSNSVRLRKSTNEETSSVRQNTTNNAQNGDMQSQERARIQPVPRSIRNEKDVTFLGLVMVALLIFLAILMLVGRRVLRAYPDVIDKSGLKDVFD